MCARGTQDHDVHSREKEESRNDLAGKDDDGNGTFHLILTCRASSKLQKRRAAEPAALASLSRTAPHLPPPPPAPSQQPSLRCRARVASSRAGRRGAACIDVCVARPVLTARAQPRRHRTKPPHRPRALWLPRPVPAHQTHSPDPASSTQA